MIKDVYKGAKTRFRICGGDIEVFLIQLDYIKGLYHALICLIMNERTKHIQTVVPWCMLFADNIILVNETKECMLSLQNGASF